MDRTRPRHAAVVPLNQHPEYLRDERAVARLQIAMLDLTAEQVRQVAALVAMMRDENRAANRR